MCEYSVAQYFYREKSGHVCTQEVLLDKKLCSHLESGSLKEHFFFIAKEKQEKSKTDILILPSLSFGRMETDIDYDYDERPYATNHEEYDFVVISACPVCGKPIVKKIKEKTDITKKVMPIIEEYDIITDEKRTAKTLKKIYELEEQFDKETHAQSGPYGYEQAKLYPCMH